MYQTEFLVINDRVSRGNSLKLYKKRGSLEISKNSFTFRVSDLWNKLPDDVVLAPDINLFKGRLDCYMRSVRGHK